MHVIVDIETADLTHKHRVANRRTAIHLALLIASHRSEVHDEGDFVPEAKQNKGCCRDHVVLQYTGDGKVQPLTAIKPCILLPAQSRKANTGISS